MLVKLVVMTGVWLVSGWSLARGDLLELNSAFDLTMERMRAAVRDEGKSEVYLDNLEEDFSYRWFFVKVPGKLICREGTIRDVSGLYRVNDVATDEMDSPGPDSPDLKLIVDLHFDRLEVAYNSCTVELADYLRQSREVRVRLKERSVSASLNVLRRSPGSTCTVSLLGFTFSGVKSVELETSGLVELVEDRIQGLLSQHINKQIGNLAANYLQKLFKDNISQGDICNATLQI